MIFEITAQHCSAVTMSLLTAMQKMNLTGKENRSVKKLRRQVKPIHYTENRNKNGR